MAAPYVPQGRTIQWKILEFHFKQFLPFSTSSYHATAWLCWFSWDGYGSNGWSNNGTSRQYIEIKPLLKQILSLYSNVQVVHLVSITLPWLISFWSSRRWRSLRLSLALRQPTNMKYSTLWANMWVDYPHLFKWVNILNLQVYKAKEDSDCCTRYFCSSNRLAFHLTIVFLLFKSGALTWTSLTWWAKRLFT